MPTDRISAVRRLGSSLGTALAVVVVAGSGLSAAAAPATMAGPAPESSGGSQEPAAEAAQEQVLEWTADDRMNEYASAPTEATAGEATLVFENSADTGNTSGIQHTLTFDTTTDGYNHDVDVDILATPDDEQNGRWSVDVTLTEGTYRFYCTIPGHGQMQGELVVTAGDGGDDTTPPEVTPTISGETDGDGSYIGAATVALEATDDDSGVDTVEYQLDDGEWTQYENPVEVTDVGEHSIAYRATDAAGNVSEPGTETFTVVEGDGEDTTPPEVSLELQGDTNNNGAYLGSAKVAISASDGNSGVDTVEYQLDGGEWTEYADAVDVSELGEHTVTYRATDVAGNVSEPGEETFTVVQSPDDDTDAPQVSASVTGELDSDWAYIGSATVDVSASDDGSGLDTVEYALDDGDWTAYEEPVEVDAEGTHTVAYRATDVAGNVSDPAETSFTVTENGSPPSCPNPDPSPTVVIDTVGTDVRNRQAQGNCTIDDLIKDEARWSEHESFVVHVEDVTANLLDAGIVNESERDAIVTAAQQSGVGKDG